MIDTFCESLHQEIHHEQMRGAVCLVGEIVNNNISLCGIGDLSFWQKNAQTLILHSFKDGIIGEAFSSSQRYDVTLEWGEFCILTTDGIDQRKMECFKTFSMQEYSAHFLAFVMLHFAGSEFDDSSLVVIKN